MQPQSERLWGQLGSRVPVEQRPSTLGTLCPGYTSVGRMAAAWIIPTAQLAIVCRAGEKATGVTVKMTAGVGEGETRPRRGAPRKGKVEEEINR